MNKLPKVNVHSKLSQPLSISFFLPPRVITSVNQVKEGDFLKFVGDEGENFTLGAFYITKDVDCLDLALNLDVENDNGDGVWRDLKDFELVCADEISTYSCFEHNGQKNALTDASGTIRLVETKEINNLSHIHIGDMLMCTSDKAYYFTQGQMYTVSMVDYRGSGMNLRLIGDNGNYIWADIVLFERVMLCDVVASDELKNKGDQPLSTESTDGEPLMLTVHVSAKDAGLSTVVNIPFESQCDAINACCDMIQYINENMLGANTHG